MTLFTGRPEDERLPVEMRVYDALDSLGISYIRADHPAAFTMEDCIAPEEALGVKICKNLFLCNRQQTAFYLLMMPADKPFRTKLLGPQIGSARLSFASPEAMKSLLDITPGSMSVLGLMNDHEKKVQLLVDEDLLLLEAIGVHPCMNTSTLKLATDDIFGHFVPSTGHDFIKVSFPSEAGAELF